MRGINLTAIMILSFGLYVANGLYHPLVSMSFNDEEIKANVIYNEWKSNENELYKNIILKHTNFIIKKSEKKVELIEEKNNFVKPSQRKKKSETPIEDIDSYKILMKNYYEKDIKKAFLYVSKYDVSYKKLNDKRKTTKEVSNFFVFIGIFLAFFLWFKNRG